jgi:hypothetical protein
VLRPSAGGRSWRTDGEFSVSGSHFLTEKRKVGEGRKSDSAREGKEARVSGAH